MPKREGEIQWRKAGEVDAQYDSFSADCLKDMASQKPDEFRWDEEDQVLYITVIQAATVIKTIVETSGDIAYEAGRYNQELIERSS